MPFNPRINLSHYVTETKEWLNENIAQWNECS